MRNSCKAGGTAKKKYKAGGGITDPPKKVRMSPAKIAVGPVKPVTTKEKEEALKKFKEVMEKEGGKALFPTAPKKKIGGPTPEDPNIYSMFKKGIFGKYKSKDISKEKFDRINNRLSRDTDNTKFGNSSTLRESVSKEGIGQREVFVSRTNRDMIKANQEKAAKTALEAAKERARAALKKQYEDNLRESNKKQYEDNLRRQYEDSLRKSKPAIMKRSGRSTKKKYEAGGGVIPAKPVMTAPMQGRLGNRPIAGGNMAKGGSTHSGFKAVQEKIAKKQGISSKAAAAILAAASRNASASAKKKNPRLKKVKG